MPGFDGLKRRNGFGEMLIDELNGWPAKKTEFDARVFVFGEFSEKTSGASVQKQPLPNNNNNSINNNYNNKADEAKLTKGVIKPVSEDFERENDFCNIRSKTLCVINKALL